ncbi:unnamed protein product, partial [Cyprideis torosa]
IYDVLEVPPPLLASVELSKYCYTQTASEFTQTVSEFSSPESTLGSFNGFNGFFDRQSLNRPIILRPIFPSLFTIEGDEVRITNYSGGDLTDEENSTGRASGKRDYLKEAVEYFQEKLLVYGPPGSEVPIRSLLGHRSQAPPEVRHISGQHIRDFRNFLASAPSVFQLTEEHVILKPSAVSDSGLGSPSKVQGSPQKAPSVTATRSLISYLTSVLDKSRNPMSVQQLYAMLDEQYFLRQKNEKLAIIETSGDPNSSSAVVENDAIRFIKSSQDLLTFLKMHSELFHVQDHLVSPRHMPQSPVKRPGSRNSPQQVSSPREESSTPFQQQTPKQRLNSVLLKALSDNAGRDTVPVSPQSLPCVLGSHESPRGEGDSGVLLTPSWRSIRVITSVKECQVVCQKLIAGHSVISLDGEGVNLGPDGPATLLQIGTGDGDVFVFDVMINKRLVTEGGLKEIFESENILKMQLNILTVFLAAVAGVAQSTLDLLAHDRQKLSVYENQCDPPFKAVDGGYCYFLAYNVMHDCRSDAAALHWQFGVTLRNVFDTQTANAVVQYQQSGRPVYKVKNVGLNTLCKLYGLPCNPRKEQLKSCYRKDQRYWARRPLTEDMLTYAAFDAYILLPTIYEKMKSLLQDCSMSLFWELCAEQVDHFITRDEVKARKRNRKVEAEVAELREKLDSAEKGKTLVLSNREIRLLRFLELSDADKEKLEGSLKVVKKLDRLAGKNAGGNESNASAEGAGTAADPWIVLSNGKLDRLEKIDRIEQILEMATSGSSPDLRAGSRCDATTQTQTISTVSECEVQTDISGDVAPVK